MNLETFTVDTDSVVELNKLRQKLQSKIDLIYNKSSADKNKRLTNKEKEQIQKDKFEACYSILETNISHLYSDISSSLDSNNIYYVYAHLDTTNVINNKKSAKLMFCAALGLEYIPFYIGKGVGDRHLDLNRNDTHRKVRSKCKAAGKDIESKIIFNNLTEQEAFEIESKLIDILGSITYKNGLLVNLDEGHKNKERKLLYKDQLIILNKINNILVDNNNKTK